MADLPQPLSYEQILGILISGYSSRQKINDPNVGAANVSLFEVVALMVARSSGDLFQVLRDFSVDRATGEALQRLAIENNITPATASPSSGTVKITDTSFTKVSTKIYTGVNPPNAGSTQIPIRDSAGFTPTGAIYLGRESANIEGPIAYTSIVPQGNYFIINLAAPTAKFHNSGELVTLSQGGVRTIPVNTIVISPAVGSNSDIQFSTVSIASILDGETEVSNVQVTALNPGASGNIPAGAINSFATAPFSGAAVTNPVPYTNGQDTETDDELRIRIKQQLASTGLGTSTAVQSALHNLTSSDEQAEILFTSILQDTKTGAATIFIDTGSGYEAKWLGVGLESIVDSA